MTSLNLVLILIKKLQRYQPDPQLEEIIIALKLIATVQQQEKSGY